MLCYNCSFLVLHIPRLEDVSTEDLIRLIEIERKVLQLSRKPLKLTFIELKKPVNVFDPLSSAWSAIWLLKPQQTLWSGYMQTVNTGNHSDWVSTFFMPMIDLKSTDRVCISSTMHFVAEQSPKYNMTPALTFDVNVHQGTARWIKCPQIDCAENRRLSPNDEFSWFDLGI